MYADKLDGLGIATPLEDIVNPVVTVPRWLQANHPGAGVFAISEEPLKRALTAAGIRLTEDAEEIDVVLASYDRTFEYRKLQIAFDALWFHRRARLDHLQPRPLLPHARRPRRARRRGDRRRHRGLHRRDLRGEPRQARCRDARPRSACSACRPTAA